MLHCQVTPGNPAMTTISTVAASAAISGRRLAHFARRSHELAGRTENRPPPSQILEVFGKGFGRGIAASRSFSRQFRQIVSRSRSILGLIDRGRGGSASSTRRRISAIDPPANGGRPVSIS